MLHCPADDSTLTVHSHGTTRFASCPNCRGLWFERGQYLTASARDHSFAPPDEHAAPSGPRPAPGLRRCARCRQKLRPRFIAAVEVDVCPACAAVWLDAGEFHAVRAWYAREGPYLPRGRIVEPIKSASPVASRSGDGSAGEMVVEIVGNVIIEGSAEAVFSFIASLFEGLFDL